MVSRSNRREGLWISVLLAAVLVVLLPIQAQAWWKPKPTVRPWQFQLQGKIDRSIPAGVFETDVDYTSRATVKALKRSGARVICYLNAGSWENFRSDRDRFPRRVLGKRYDGYPDERWLDISRYRLFAPVIESRVKKCRSKGFDGIEFDNVNGWENPTGFSITRAEQLRYNRWLARLAHRHRLAAGLKNDGPQVPRLVKAFDFAVVEQCFQYDECGQYRPFIEKGKAVFSVEYELPTSAFCDRALDLGFSSIAKDYDLFALPWQPCVTPPS